jgi:predicted TIM-barrel fold metal-dependent hydrolase
VSTAAANGHVIVISADGHAGLPVHEYGEYMEKRYQGALQEYAARFPHPEEAAAAGAESGLARDEHQTHMMAESLGRGLYDPEIRLKQHEQDGVVADVVFPNFDATGVPFGLGFGQFRGVRDRELRSAGARAYNRWLVDFCGTNPDRMAGLAVVPWHDVEAAVAEVRWAADHGLRGVVLETNDFELPSYADEYYEPIWAECAAHRMVLNTHGGTGVPAYGAAPGADPYTFTRKPWSAFVLLTEHGWWSRRPFWFLLWSGALERHPELKMAFTEEGSEWVPGMLAHLDHLYTSPLMAPVKPLIDSAVTMKPSEYFARQCFVGSSCSSRGEAAMVHEIGIDNVMFGTDYPHPESSWGKTKEWLQGTYGISAKDADELQKVAGGNAARCYGFDLDRLAPLAAQVGPTVEEVLHQPFDPPEGVEFALMMRGSTGST